jgi:tetratricopeptide (TPR) repeat protein
MLLTAGIARAEKSILFVKVMDWKNNPMRGVSLALEEPGCVALGPSDDRGVLRIKLAPGINPQTWVTLELTGARYAFLQPYDRRAQVPGFENEAVNYLRVFLMSKGDRAALESGKFAVQMAAQFNAKLTPQPKVEAKSEAVSEGQRKTVLAELAAGVGLKPDEIDHAIRAYGGKTSDPYEAGVIALYERNYAKATAELTRSYEMREQALDKAREEMIAVAISLGQSLYKQGSYREAIVRFQKADALKPDDSIILNWLGLSLHDAGRYVEAEPLYKQALETREKALGKDHPSTATSLNNLAGLYDLQGRYAEAEPLYKRALEIHEKALGKDHPSTAIDLNNLALLYKSQGKYAEAEPLYKLALTIFEAALGPEHPNMATVLGNYADLLRKMNRMDEAARLEARAKEIRAKAR